MGLWVVQICVEKKKTITKKNQMENIKDYVTCKVCGKQLSRITSTHLKVHNMTMEEYVERFGSDELVSEAYHNRVSMQTANRNLQKPKAMTKEEFIERSKALPFGDMIDHSQIEWVNTHTHVTLIDKEFGPWQITPTNRLKGRAHPKRRGSRIQAGKSCKQDEFIRRAQEVHKGENLDYSKVKYVNMHTKVTIIDPEYGEFEQEPVVHLKGCGHPKRAIAKNADRCRYTTEEFINIAQSRYPNKYDMSKVDYKTSQEKVVMICPKHGEFTITPGNFMQGKGCPKCACLISKAEDEIYNICCDVVGKENVIRKDRTVLDKFELDILIPSHHLAIEFNGIRWHSEQFKADKNYHLTKTKICEKKGIRLIHIFEDEWIWRREIVEMRIRRILGDSKAFKRIYARKCTVREINNSEAKDFLDKNHIQGATLATIYLGAFHENNLIGVMTFKREHDEGYYDLNRFATEMHTSVVGLASKMLTYFIRNYNPAEIKSFLDRRWGSANNNVYIQMGFVLTETLKPSYWYTDGRSKRNHKFGFRKDKLKKLGNFNDDMTEHEMANALGYYRIWDCGLFKYVWTANKKELP